MFHVSKVRFLIIDVINNFLFAAACAGTIVARAPLWCGHIGCSLNSLLLETALIERNTAKEIRKYLPSKINGNIYLELILRLVNYSSQNIL